MSGVTARWTAALACLLLATATARAAAPYRDDRCLAGTLAAIEAGGTAWGDGRRHALAGDPGLLAALSAALQRAGLAPAPVHGGLAQARRQGVDVLVSLEAEIRRQAVDNPYVRSVRVSTFDATVTLRVIHVPSGRVLGAAAGPARSAGRDLRAALPHMLRRPLDRLLAEALTDTCAAAGGQVTRSAGAGFAALAEDLVGALAPGERLAVVTRPMAPNTVAERELARCSHRLEAAMRQAADSALTVVARQELAAVIAEIEAFAASDVDRQIARLVEAATSDVLAVGTAEAVPGGLRLRYRLVDRHGEALATSRSVTIAAAP
jgi:hypothetical protein